MGAFGELVGRFTIHAKEPAAAATIISYPQNPIYLEVFIRRYIAELKSLLVRSECPFAAKEARREPVNHM